MVRRYWALDWFAIGRKNPPELRGQVIRTYTTLLFDLVLVVFALLFLHNPLRLVAIASLSYFLALIVSITIRLMVIRWRAASPSLPPPTND